MAAGDGRLGVSVRDRGPGFNPPPTVADAPPLGFGLALIASLTDQFSVQGGSRGTEIQMSFALAPEALDAALPLTDSQLAVVRPTPGADIVLDLEPGPFVAPVLGRVVSMIAARADFSIDRLSDAQ